MHVVSPWMFLKEVTYDSEVTRGKLYKETKGKVIQTDAYRVVFVKDVRERCFCLPLVRNP